MRSGDATARLAFVRQPLGVYVEFDTGGEPIAGRLETSEGQQPFTGWLGLISGLERAIGAWHQAGSSAGSPQTRRPAQSPGRPRGPLEP